VPLANRFATSAYRETVVSLGAGGMGEVYRADRHGPEAREVAIKVRACSRAARRPFIGPTTAQAAFSTFPLPRHQGPAEPTPLPQRGQRHPLSRVPPEPPLQRTSGRVLWGRGAANAGTGRLH
jgi:hypothetical protein